MVNKSACSVGSKNMLNMICILNSGDERIDMIYDGCASWCSNANVWKKIVARVSIIWFVNVRLQ
jgi:hypothetical protein